MRRNEAQLRPTAGCLSVPLFNQRKRSRLPLTSNPSESEAFPGGSDDTDASINAACLVHVFEKEGRIRNPKGSVGYTQASNNRAPITQRSEWNQQINLNPEQTKAWPATSSCSTGYGHVPNPQKPTYERSQTGMQRAVSRQDSTTMAQNRRLDGFPSVGGTSQAQLEPFSGKQPMKLQSFSRQTNPTRASFPHQKILPTQSHSQGPGPQSQSTQWRFRSVGHRSPGGWVEDTFGVSNSERNLQQQKAPVLDAKPSTKNSLRILTAVIEGMKHWSQFKDKVAMLFEIFATLDSAVTVGKYGAKNFLMRDGKDVVPCVYYEIDQVLPRLIRGQVHRCLGNYDRHKNILTCVSVRPATSSEQRNAQEAVKMSDAEMRNVVQALSEM